MSRNQQLSRQSLDLEARFKEIDQFYDPLMPIKLISNIPKPLACCKTLFDDDDENDQDNFLVDTYKRPPFQPKQVATKIVKEVKEDNFLKRILANSTKPAPKPKKKEFQVIQVIPQYESFCFNTDIILKYPQTPHFKNQLHSPFWKFNAQHKVHIESLKQKTIKADFQPVDINEDPLKFVGESLRYFVGIGLTLKENECISASRALLKLGCYVEPFNERSWRKYIELQEQYGYIYKAFILSKTAFLFTQNEQFAKSYIANGQKCGVALGEMRGILNSAPPQTFQKGVLVEIGKLTLKHQQIWKGLKVLYEICQWSQFRLPVCALIIFLSKYLQNIGQRQKALIILKKSFGRGMSKLQIYTTYLQMKIREDKDGILRDNVIKQMKDYLQCISSQNRYRVYLEIGELLFFQNDQRYKDYIEQSYLAAKKYCAPGTGCNKTLRQIYNAVLRWKNACPPPAMPNDSIRFQSNRYEFISKGIINICQFSDWKFYLHYGLTKNSQILQQASKKWSYTGRLVAEWIHTLRGSLCPREVLRIWRQKIDEVPKSGELWCQGGRIFAQLHDYENSSKCFKAAIHFTPQYGDSFIEQLRVYLIKGQFMQVHKLKKIMLISEPFYGHVWSFLKESKPGQGKLSLRDMWEMATHEINSSIYKENIGLLRPADKDYRLLTAFSPYNEAYLCPNTPELRRKLFASYEQLDNKN